MELERMERDKTRMLAEMEAEEEEKQQQEERMAIRDVTDLAEFYPNVEGELDKDTVMADSEEDVKRTDNPVAYTDELESPVKKSKPWTNAKMMIFLLMNFQQKRRAARSKGDTHMAIDKKKW